MEVYFVFLVFFGLYLVFVSLPGDDMLIWLDRPSAVCFFALDDCEMVELRGALYFVGKHFAGIPWWAGGFLGTARWRTPELGRGGSKLV